MIIVYIALGILAVPVLAILATKIFKSPDGNQKLVGESGIVLSDISLDQNGVIKLGGKEYIASSESGAEIPKNCKAVVKKATDQKLFVERVKF